MYSQHGGTDKNGRGWVGYPQANLAWSDDQR
jgi:hypothetical protein